MLLGEPSRTAYDLNFRIGEVPVRVHPFFWLVALLLGAGGGLPKPQFLIIWIVVLFVSILVHELGHVLAFKYYGIRSHVVLYGMGGLAVPQGSYGYGSHQGDRGFPRIVISLAGPAAGFLLAALVVAILCAINRSFTLPIAGSLRIRFGFGPPLINIPIELFYAIWQLLFVNIVWGLVNLLPVYPLDGGQVSRELFLKQNPSRGVHNSLMLSAAAAAAMALFAATQKRWFVAIMFGVLAYQSYQYMQMNSGGWGGGFGGGGGYGGGYGGGGRGW